MPKYPDQFATWNEATQKFDYFMAGLSGAIVAFVGQSFVPHRLGFNPSTLELLALVLLIASFWCAIKRIEIYTDFLRLTLQRDHFEDKAIILRTNSHVGEVKKIENGEVVSQEEKKQLDKENITKANMAQEKLESQASKASKYYSLRNYLIIAGFVLLLISRVSSVYVCGSP
jgi:hypothetical protein